jgi:hypothetical protein
MGKIMTYDQFDIHLKRKNEYFKSKIKADIFIEVIMELISKKIVYYFIKKAIV